MLKGWALAVDSIYELAKVAGVTPSTVSRALRDDKRISAATRTRIQALAAAANFTPSSAARSLTTRRSMTVGLVVRDYADPYNGMFMRGIESALLPAAYQLVVGSTHQADLSDIGRMFRQRRVDGVIVLASHRDESAAALDRSIPLVFACERPGYIPQRPRVGLVTLDEREAARTITQHLIGLGHRRIGFVCIGRLANSSLDRHQGYLDALTAAGIEPDPQLVVSPTRREYADAGAEAVAMVLPAEPTAIFFYNDASALGGLRALQDRGLAVPDDISIVGFDDLEFSALLDPPLTTMSQPRFEIGRISGEQVLRLIEGETETTRIDTSCTLVVRRSTGRPKTLMAGSGGQVA